MGNPVCEAHIPTTRMSESYLSEDTRLYAERVSDRLFEAEKPKDDTAPG
jgi:hypothetical protein